MSSMALAAIASTSAPAAAAAGRLLAAAARLCVTQAAPSASPSRGAPASTRSFAAAAASAAASAASAAAAAAPPMTVGFVGVGNMGSAMAGALLRAGHRLLVFDRNPAAVEALVARGAAAAASPKAIAETPGALFYL